MIQTNHVRLVCFCGELSLCSVTRSFNDESCASPGSGEQRQVGQLQGLSGDGMPGAHTGDGVCGRAENPALISVCNSYGHFSQSGPAGFEDGQTFSGTRGGKQRSMWAEEMAQVLKSDARCGTGVG